MSKKLLDVQNIKMVFGGICAIDNLSFHIGEGELIGLIGPNGAGKTTVFNMLTGVYKTCQGRIDFQGEDISQLDPFQISHRGIARTFQNIRLFKELSVLDNVLLGRNLKLGYKVQDAILANKFFETQEGHLRNKGLELLSLFKLESKANEKAGSLPYGEQRKLEIIRALATDPKLICLDEPAAGMNHAETHSLMETIAQIRREFNLTVLLIEHDMKLVMGICERILVLDHGVLIEEGGPKKIQNSPKVIEAYLGAEAL